MRVDCCALTRPLLERLSGRRRPADPILRFFSEHLELRGPGCGYTYDDALGDNHEGYPLGFRFDDLLEDFVEEESP